MKGEDINQNPTTSETPPFIFQESEFARAYSKRLPEIHACSIDESVVTNLPVIPMELDLFFKGTLRKEEVASAFLATALRSSREFRRFFFREVWGDGADALAEKSWDVEVEGGVGNGRIDVSLKSDDVFVIVENKVAAGAVQDGQLVRYYRHLRQELAPGKRVLVAYVAPGKVGVAEVDELQEIAGNDRAAHISWEALAEFCGDAEIAAGLAVVKRVVEEARKAKYGRDPRRPVSDSVDAALIEIQPSAGEVRLSRWSGRDAETILTGGSSVTVWIEAVFHVQDHEPWDPVGLVDPAGKLTLDLRLQFKLAGRVKRTDPLYAEWSELVRTGFVDVPDLGTFRVKDKKWLVFAEPFVGEGPELTKRVAQRGVTLFRWLRERFRAVTLQAHVRP